MHRQTRSKMVLRPHSRKLTWFVFNRLTGWRSRCLKEGMNFWMILIAAQVIVAIIAFVSGTRQDPRFQDEKLEFRD